MKDANKMSGRRGSINNQLRTWGAIAALMLPLTFSTGCEDQVKKEFINAALPSLETGVQSILTGLLTGTTAVIEQDLGTSSNTTSDGTSS